MLDEILEYQQYTFDIDNSDARVQRLKRSTLICLNDKVIALTGLNRVLTIIARHFLFEVYNGDERLKEKTIDALKSWLGHKVPDDSASVEAHRLYRWLSAYVEKVLLSESIEKLEGFISSRGLSTEDEAELRTIIRQLSDQRPQNEKVALADRLKDMCTKLRVIPGNDHVEKSVLKAEKFLYQLPNRRSFNTSGYDDFGEANTVNAITYDRILGNARRAGRLTRYYLACDRSLIGNVKNKSGRKLKDTDRDIVLKMTACCMMELSKKGTKEVYETKSISITEADFVNWIINAKCEKDKQESFYYNGEMLFEDPNAGPSTEKKHSNTKWLRLNRQWLKDSGFEILSDSSETDVVMDFLRSHPQGSVFIDNGSSVPMTEVRIN